MATPAPGTAESLYQDPTAAYAPALEAIAAQETAANQRYATNKADITNIFGSLSTLGAADAARINQQFTQSITEQAAGLAARTAEARTGVAKNVEAVKTVGAERGAGPAMLGSPVATEAEAGIGRANAYQQTWAGLMGANQTQAVADTGARQQGYALMQKDALTALNKNLEEQMLNLGQQRTGIQGNIAQAKMQARQSVLNAKYQEAQDALARARSAASAAEKQPTYTKNVAGWANEVTDLGDATSPAQLIAIANEEIGRVSAALKRANAKDYAGNPAKPSRSLVISLLTRDKNYKDSPWIPYIIDYINKYSGLK